jgi:hypothetical protein
MVQRNRVYPPDEQQPVNPEVLYPGSVPTAVYNHHLATQGASYTHVFNGMSGSLTAAVSIWSVVNIAAKYGIVPVTHSGDSADVADSFDMLIAKALLFMVYEIKVDFPEPDHRIETSDCCNCLKALGVDTVHLKCGHCLHRGCAMVWLSTHPGCPACGVSNPDTMLSEVLSSGDAAGLSQLYCYDASTEVSTRIATFGLFVRRLFEIDGHCTIVRNTRERSGLRAPPASPVWGLAQTTEYLELLRILRSLPVAACGAAPTARHNSRDEENRSVAHVSAAICTLENGETGYDESVFNAVMLDFARMWLNYMAGRPYDPVGRNKIYLSLVEAFMVRVTENYTRPTIGTQQAYLMGLQSRLWLCRLTSFERNCMAGVVREWCDKNVVSIPDEINAAFGHYLCVVDIF